ncbi:peptidoglycan-binding protein [Vampirovibrio chlorellavorus]|uniref:peptidoglycan-binding protein n=1 Tax=Vampirovibrio chlorellavorus TaxID=758823 RepID=UPI0026F012E2|nr:peptidoglycan-binding protein [Vampirovibrio chlorellavorus]
MPNFSPPVPGRSQRGPNEPGLALMHPGDSGNAVRVIQTRLAQLGFHQGAIDGTYGAITQKAVAAFQRSQGLYPTGLVDHQTLRALGYEVDPAAPPPTQMNPSIEAVAKLFPDAPVNNIRNYLPLVLRALAERGLGDKSMVLMALATIRAETASFAPISEYQSKYNTAPGGKPYALYDFRSDLGNNAAGDGDRYKGRGFIQLTGKSNYATYSQKLGLGDLLLRQPDAANDPVIAARVLAAFLKDKEGTIRSALAKGDLKTARKSVNGGTHGLDVFTLTFQKGAKMSNLAYA